MKALEVKGYLIRLIDIPNELRAFQRAVDGYIETITLADGGVMIVDEEGTLKDKPVNTLASLIAGVGIVGTALIVGAKGDEFCDVPERYMALLDLNDELAEERKSRSGMAVPKAADVNVQRYYNTESGVCQDAE